MILVLATLALLYFGSVDNQPPSESCSLVAPPIHHAPACNDSPSPEDRRLSRFTILHARLGGRRRAHGGRLTPSCDGDSF